MCVRKLSTTPGERVPAVCQPNGQKLGHSELFNSFLGGEETLPISPLRKKKPKDPALIIHMHTHTHTRTAQHVSQTTMPSVRSLATGPELLN